MFDEKVILNGSSWKRVGKNWIETVSNSAPEKGKRSFTGAKNLYDNWMEKKRKLMDEYRYPGFRPRAEIKGIFGDPKARVIRFKRVQRKTVCGSCGKAHRSYYDKRVRRIRDLFCGDARIYLEVEVRRVLCRRCGKVKREEIRWLADNPFYTKRLAYYVGRKCRAMTVKDVARELKLDWHTVKALDKKYMEEQFRRNPVGPPRVIGIDELSLRKGHIYRIVVSDLERNRPIWYGGDDRSEASLDRFYQWLGPKKTKKTSLAVMDMWKAFEKSTKKNVPQAAILYDKFHVMRHLGKHWIK